MQTSFSIGVAYSAIDQQTVLINGIRVVTIIRDDECYLAGLFAAQMLAIWW